MTELKRRNVIRMAGLYLVGAWLVVQVASTVFPAFELPSWTLRGVILLLAIGFIPALIFSWLFELTPGGLKRDAEVPADASIAPLTARRLDHLIIAALLLALAYFAIDKFFLAPPRNADAPSLPSTARADESGGNDAIGTPSAHPKSIAVLAFANMSTDKDNEYFSDGVAEEILNALAKIEDLKVAGRTSSFYFKGRNEPLAMIGNTLGVAYVLEGSVRKQAERLRITAKLVRVRDGVELWSDIFDGTDADIFALQETIAQQVASELKVALDAGQQDRLVDVGTRDPDAYALYLMASDVFNKRDYERYDEAIKALGRALDLDPAFARGHSRLSALHYVWASNSAGERYRQSVIQAKRHAEQALRLNPSLAEPHAVLSILSQHERDYPASRARLQRALELDPNDPTANLWSSIFRCQTGHITECERGLDRTLAIDPLLPNALNWRARLWVSAGDLDEAQRMIDRAREAGLRWAAAATLQWIALKRGDMAMARSHALETYQALGADLPPEAPAIFADAVTGDTAAIAKSNAIIETYLEDAPSPISSLAPIVLVRMGEIDRGLQVFATHRTTNEAAFLGDIMGTRLRTQVWASPYFPEFLRKTGLAAYWDEFGAPEHCRKIANGDYRCE